MSEEFRAISLYRNVLDLQSRRYWSAQGRKSTGRMNVKDTKGVNLRLSSKKEDFCGQIFASCGLNKTPESTQSWHKSGWRDKSQR